MRSNKGRLFRTNYMWSCMLLGAGSIGLFAAGTALNPDVPVPGRVVGAVVAMVIAGFLASARRAGIKVDNRQVIVRRYSGISTAVDWDDVSGFELMPTGKHDAVFLAVVLADGRRLTTYAVCAVRPTSRKVQQFVAELAAKHPPA